ncbi:deoxyribose-phosphate aldolase [Micromonospora sp. NPDC051925]|uniref:deoxyribose-phosphate aldolase n=1 Tax=Micromonospora sp. NPDC051925 TaxID=3364288 RepID=UPI0037C7B675
MSAAMTPVNISVERVAKMIDHSLLRPELTIGEVGDGCELALRYDVASVCVKPADVPFAAGLLAGTDVAVGTVVGFPHGSSTSRIKAAETAAALNDGAREIDMVINIGWLRQRRDDDVLADIEMVVREAGDAALVKVILENAYLDTEEKIRGCRISEQAGADYVKTSTGFAPGGATLDDLRLMRATVPPRMGVKAAGGVRTLDLLLTMAEIGVTRFGATATATILDDLRARIDGQHKEV